MLILNLNDEKNNEKIDFEISVLEEFRTFFLTQKDILLKHFNISLISMSNDSNYIIELNKFLEDFNIIFDKINSSLKSIDILKKKLDIAKSSLLDPEEKINEYINSYNESYISDFPKLLDCMNYTIDFIEKLFVTPTYEESKKRALEMFSIKPDKNKEKKLSKIENIPTNINVKEQIIDSLETNKENLLNTNNIENNDIKDDKKDIDKNNSNDINMLSNSSNTETLTTDAINKLDLQSKYLSENENNNKNDNNKDNIASSNDLENETTDLNLEPAIKNKNIKTNDRVTKLPLQDNNSLIISEKDGLVYLPFKVEDLKKEYIEKHKKYKGLIDLINHEYILPINKYKNTVTSRFKEAYSLMVNKEKESALSGLELGLEVAFNYSLHPAVISACKSLDELDEYLDALDAKDMSSFKRFKVEFEVLPK